MSNFFAHYVFTFPLERSATVSLKTYGSKIIVKPCSSKTAEVIEMVNNEIDSDTEQILIGSLLGDGGLQFQKRSINALFRETHGIKQKEYLDKIGLLALAIWYCDDGSFGYINQNAKIATYLSYKDNKLIVDFLKERFKINCTINKDGGSYHIYFSVQEIRKFLSLIKGYVPRCINHKLGPFAKGNNERLIKENLKRRQKDKVRYYKYMVDPVRHELIRKQQRENQKRRLQNPEYRKRYNEYYKNWRKQKQSHPNR